MTDSSPIEAVTLDLDGTLYSIRRMIFRNPFVMLPIMDVFRDLHRIRAELRGMGPFPDFRTEQARRLAERRGITPEQAARLVERVIDQRWMTVFKRVRLFKGVRTAIEQLRDSGVRLGLISDYPVLPKIAGMGLSDIPFQAVVNAEETGALKPHPASFQKASELLGIEPGRILHVGDREDCDVAGALASGFRAALFCRKKLPDESRAQLVFSDWRKLVSLLKQRGYLLK